ncbi:PREDICTED: uncharacterized protein C3orf30 homolog [Chinchilla lanigera]|uniref:Testis expressed 55 n=1 Tax=Chinchilla lanigera TaxID=34839 RepID=A0A8C2VM59_CHILA|nr:PREDICTED: uncharacterized protein C3orf30 homolog [Chinchilla lanigera]XP_005386487.1 PREDICTED: uncharacterized protein C3orf30 homolog [Chinchilla lanigera]XP_005386488.1 PREDICTED: uncharacterized protein C3orf30 homolog [Chinchilla lanigera]XP_005386489.1 PREDICTED: uncharacterized protein C3orf30 homolog [Chinchilla lanigera]XP_005386490.1 PREDICTED: uncharacterized protein C3orf30 homolog [Chinchilla lanigera]
MDELLEEGSSESLGPQSTAIPPNVGPTNNLEEDNQENQSKEDEDDHTVHRIADQIIHAVYSQHEAIISAQADHRVSEDSGYTVHDQYDQKSSDSTDDKTSSQANGIAYRQVEHGVPDLTDRTAEQVDRRLSNQAGGRASEQVNRRSSNQPDRRASEQVDHRGSSQAGRRASEPVGHKLSSQANKRALGQVDYSQADRRVSEQVGHKLSGQADKRGSEQVDHGLSTQVRGLASQQIDDTLSMPPNKGASENDQHRISDQKTSEQIDFKLSSLAERTEKADLILSDQDEPRTAIQYYQATKPTEQQDIYQADISTDKLMVGRGPYSEEYQVNNFTGKQADQKENSLSYHRTGDQSEDRISSQFSNQDKQNDYSIQPSKFEPSQLQDHKPKLSMTTESQSPTTSQAFTDDARVTSNLQGKDQAFYSKLPAVLSILDPNTSQRKTQATEIKPFQDDFSEFEQENTSHTQKQGETPRGSFPPIVYEDPYQVSLQYMEEHNILQIFQQITENLVFEKPQDPLHFMLCQVQKMIKNRGKK